MSLLPGVAHKPSPLARRPDTGAPAPRTTTALLEMPGKYRVGCYRQWLDCCPAQSPSHADPTPTHGHRPRPAAKSRSAKYRNLFRVMQEPWVAAGHEPATTAEMCFLDTALAVEHCRLSEPCQSPQSG